MRFFDFIQKYYGIRMFPYFFAHFSSIVITDISRRGAYQSGRGEFFGKFSHVNADKVVLRTEKFFCQGFGEFGFPDTGRPEKYECPDRPVRVFESGAVAFYRTYNAVYGFVLADYPFFQPHSEDREFFSFVFRHFFHRYS